MKPAPFRIPKRFPWMLYWIPLLLIAVFAFAPVASVILCSFIANAHGCKVDEGSVHPCIINNQDYGHLLYELGVLGWLMLFTLPAGLFAFVIWLIVLILHRANWKKRVSARIPPPIPPSLGTA
ncbi:MAG TPA: hypothetical protein VFQ78_10545 [Candidatus Udaeobacter sp.]|nr:hypothetical protein [Candidatus Udaeobacter sp.]